MSIRLNDSIDGLMEKALAEQPLEPVPLTLYRRVTRGIRIATWRRREEVRFRYTLAVWLGGFVLALVAAGAAIVSTNLSNILGNGVSGGLGWFDYYAAALHVSLSGYTCAYSLAAAVLIAGGTLLLALAPLSHFLRGH